MKTLNPEQIEFSFSSLGDRDGRFFEWQGDLYRAITLDRSPFFEKLFQEDVIEHLISNDFLVESTSAHVNLPGYGLVVKHRKVPFVSYDFIRFFHCVEIMPII